MKALRIIRDMLWYALGIVVGVLFSANLIGLLSLRIWAMLFIGFAVLTLATMIAMRIKEYS